MRATIERLRSGASVTLGNESIADTSTGRSMPPMPARSVANTRRSGGSGNGGGDSAVTDTSNGHPIPVAFDTNTQTNAANRDYAQPVFAALDRCKHVSLYLLDRANVWLGDD